MARALGISAFYHDSAAALVVDGEIVAAVQEERFTRRKHDDSFPTHAVAACLRIGDLTAAELDWVGFYDKPLLKFERLVETYLAYAPRGFRSFARALPEWARTKLDLPRVLGRALPGHRRRFVFCEHHQSHAASAFFPSPFENAAILTMDGVGEWATATLGTGAGNRIALTHQLRFPHSLGLLYSAFTSYVGFRVNSGEYKLMGLAPFGEPRFVGAIREHLLDLKADGSFRLDMSYFRFAHGLTMTSPKFHRLFGGPARRPESEITQRHMDLAASIQAVTEEIVLRMARHLHRQTGEKNLCLAGGVALNCVANGRLLREGPFESIWAQPAAGDAGGALGTALLIEHQLLNRPRRPAATDGQQGSLLGPGHSDRDIARFLRSIEAPASWCDDDEALCGAVADALAEGKIVGWFQGRMEYGPRALGARSILADPRRPEMRHVLNEGTKFREPFRPFAAAVLRDRASDYFELDRESPYMLFVARVREDRRTVPAVTHVDHSSRIQTVDDVRFPLFARLLRAFEARTGCPLLINTSFNVRGEPLAATPEDAYRCFRNTRIDVLALGHYLLRKDDLEAPSASELATYRARFPLD